MEIAGLFPVKFHERGEYYRRWNNPCGIFLKGGILSIISFRMDELFNPLPSNGFMNRQYLFAFDFLEYREYF